MGIILWVASGCAAFILARIIPLARPRARAAELWAALLTAPALGVAATALDFGGWNEPDWRAGLFAFLGALGAAGVIRAMPRRSPPAPAAAAPPDPRRGRS